MSAVQPSGACEALASNTPLILTKSALTEVLFGGWAVLVENNVESLVKAIRSLKDDPLALDAYRRDWNEGVTRGIAELATILPLNTA
jgi:glycosyltransferase involved in cell wall biosynthesis